MSVPWEVIGMRMVSGMLRWVDVSKWQSVMNWLRAIKKLDFAYAKVGQGTWLDPQWENNYFETMELSFPLGMYFYWDNTVSWKAQSQYFKSWIDGYPTGLLPMIDLEQQKVAPKMVDVLNFLADIIEHIGAMPIIYTSPSYILQHMAKIPEFGEFPLCIANYATDKKWPLAAPRVPLPFWALDWWGWQFSADGNGMGPYLGAQSNAIDMSVAWCLPVWEPA